MAGNRTAAPPAIEPRYLTSEADLEVLVEGTGLARSIAQSQPFDAYRGEELWPGPDGKTEAGIRDFLRRRTETLYHPVGTCRMGSDARAVVDARLRVHGVSGLRVVAASVMPEITTGHSNAPVMMIAEKAAELIRQETH